MLVQHCSPIFQGEHCSEALKRESEPWLPSFTGDSLLRATCKCAPRVWVCEMSLRTPGSSQPPQSSRGGCDRDTHTSWAPPWTSGPVLPEGQTKLQRLILGSATYPVLKSLPHFRKRGWVRSTYAVITDELLLRAGQCQDVPSSGPRLPQSSRGRQTGPHRPHACLLPGPCA